MGVKRFQDPAERRAYVRGAWDALVERGCAADIIAEVFADLHVDGMDVLALVKVTEKRQEEEPKV